MALRRLARRFLLTSNTIRYRIEYRALAACLQKVGKVFDVLVDAGAGSGEMSLRLYRDGWCNSLLGVEPFEENFRLLKENYRGLSSAKIHQAPLEAMPLADGVADAVLSTQVFEHITDHEAAAQEVIRILKPGGTALISVPHPPEFIPNPEHVRPGYTEEELRRLFEPLGLQWVHSEYFFTLESQLRLFAALQLPWCGRYLPVSWADREEDLTNEERRERQPYGIACLFQKPVE